MSVDDTMNSVFPAPAAPYISPPLSQPVSEPTDLFSGGFPAIELPPLQSIEFGAIPAVHFGPVAPIHFGPTTAFHTGPATAIHTGPATAIRTGPATAIHTGPTTALHSAPAVPITFGYARPKPVTTPTSVHRNVVTQRAEKAAAPVTVEGRRETPLKARTNSIKTNNTQNHTNNTHNNSHTESTVAIHSQVASTSAHPSTTYATRPSNVRSVSNNVVNHRQTNAVTPRMEVLQPPHNDTFVRGEHVDLRG